MEEKFGLRGGAEPLVIDGGGKLRFRVLGEVDEKTYAKLVQVIETVRKEMVGPK